MVMFLFLSICTFRGGIILTALWSRLSEDDSFLVAQIRREFLGRWEMIRQCFANAFRKRIKRVYDTTPAVDYILTATAFIRTAAGVADIAGAVHSAKSSSNARGHAHRQSSAVQTGAHYRSVQRKRLATSSRVTAAAATAAANAAAAATSAGVAAGAARPSCNRIA